MRKSLDEVKAIIAGHRGDLRRVYGIRALAVFGSYARGEQKRGSDLDIIAEFDRPISLLDLVSAEQYLGGILGVKVDLIPKEEVRPELRAGIVREAISV